jgi:hypothetical protein
MINNITIRFFCYEPYNWTDDMDIIEIDESTFLRLGGEISYERHTFFDNDCRQICLTTNAYLEE